jgi:hypothetical protein
MTIGDVVLSFIEKDEILRTVFSEFEMGRLIAGAQVAADGLTRVISYRAEPLIVLECEGVEVKLDAPVINTPNYLPIAAADPLFLDKLRESMFTGKVAIDNRLEKWRCAGH